MTKRIVGSGGGGGGGCFLGHTLVRTPDGERRIDELQPGDLVLSFDDRGEIHEAKVLKVHVHEGEKVIRYRLWGGAVLDATPNHWVLNQYNAFVEIDTLGSDDCLVDENGHLRPIVDRHQLCIGTVYNLTVEKRHTFIAGGIRVHNAGLGVGIIGSGGGGGGGGKGGGGGSPATYTPTEAADSLDSAAYAKVLDLIGEGEIQGLKDGHKSIFLNNTPLQNPDGSYNFKNVTVYTRNGTPDQGYIPGFDETGDEIPVNVVVQNGTPITRTITNSNTDAVRVTITVPALQQIQDNGDITGASCQLQIYVQNNGGGYVLKVDDTISGRTADQYQRDYIVNVSGAFPVDIRVVRVTPNSTSAKLSNAFNWTSYTRITYAKLRYPNAALVGLRVDAEQFSSIPSRSYRVRGLKVRIPQNATVDQTTGALIYSGTWNGTFKAATWCSDPAWCLYDLLTSRRYGFGQHVDEGSLDKWAFYAASQYCSALNTRVGGTTDDYHATTGKHGVPDGFGGYEPRFSCNVNIQTQDEAYKLINDMCSVFRAMPYWSTGTLTISQDRPADPAYLFTLANVTEEGFNYSSSSLKSRPTVAVVGYTDLDLRDTAYEVVEAPTSVIAKYGSVVREIKAFACTSRGQAQRLGEWLLYSEAYENEVVSFTASIEAGVIVRPGQIISIADPVRSGVRRGGRVAAATTTQIQIDNQAASDLPETGNPTLSVILPTGVVETRSVIEVFESVITVSTPFSVAPQANSIWVYQNTGLEASQWRVLSVEERDGTFYSINALSYNSTKYDYVERGKPLQFRDVTNLNELPEAPVSPLSVSEALYSYKSEVRAKIILGWKSVNGVNQYLVKWRKDSGNWSQAVVQGPDYEILNITPGYFEFQVYSINAAGKTSTSSLGGLLTAQGKTAPPANVTGFTNSVDPSIGVTLTWNPVSDIDVKEYEIRRGLSWDTGTLVTRVSATSYKIGYLDSGTTTYLIKAIDDSGIYSSAATSTSVAIAAPGTPTVSSTVAGDLATITWTDAAGSYTPAYYDIRFGNNWVGGTQLAKVSTNSYSLPVTWNGARTFWVAVVDPKGTTSAAGSTIVTNTTASAPSVSGSIEGSSATLSWGSVQGTLATRFYEIRDGATFATATVIATIQSTSYSFRANWTGAKTFWVAAVDSSGAYGAGGSISLTVAAAAAPSVASTFFGDQVQLSWGAVAGTLQTASYQIRRGSTFATATVLGNITGTTFNVKVDWASTQKFWVVAVDINGSFGTAGSIDVVVPAPSQPTVTQEVVDNNVLLRWTDSTTVLPIVYYELRKGTTWATAEVIGTKQGRFTTVFETASGNFTYWLAGVDSAGNYGTPGSITAKVNQPPDYVLQLNFNSSFTGTGVNTFAEGGALYANVNTTETWEQHFTTRGWTTLQDAINGGFTTYALPSLTTGSYEEEIDYGAVIAGTQVSATITSTNVVGTTTATPTLRVRGTTATSATYAQAGTTITVTSTAHGLAVGDFVWLDFTTGTATDRSYAVATVAANTFTVTAVNSLTTSGNVSWVKWTTFSGQSNIYSTGFRYVRVRYDFASAGGDDLLKVTALNLKLASKSFNDSGTGVAAATDVGGTTVNFNVNFVDVTSITVTPNSTTPRIAVYDFVDVPNPTSFKVLLYDTAGNRASGSFSWTAKGV